MALFTDGPAACLEDLVAHDSRLLEVASGEGIDVTRKIALAHGELAVELLLALNRLRGAEATAGAPNINLNYVVVTPPLSQWESYRALELVYIDAYDSQLNDRYAGKRDQFHKWAKRAYETLIETGIGMAWDPLPRAATPELAPATGALPDSAYYVSMAWVNARGEEGASAIPAVIATSQSTVEVRPLAAPQIATGWNVYLGEAPELMVLQNASAIPPGDRWQQPAVLITAGRTAGSGQEPNYFRPVPRLIQRG